MSVPHKSGPTALLCVMFAILGLSYVSQKVKTHEAAFY